MEIVGNLITLANAPDDLPNLLQLCRTEGGVVRVHAETTYELHAPHIVLANPALSLPIGTGWPMDVATIARSTLELIAASDWMDTIHGLMVAEGMTRRAALPFWRAEDLAPEPAEPLSVPTMLAEQFMFRDEKLHLHVFLRALDVVLAPFVLFSSAQMLLCFANIVRTEIAGLHLHPTSLYLRAGDVGRTEFGERVKVPQLDVAMEPQPDGFRGTKWGDIQATARGLLDPTVINRKHRLDPSEQWFAEVLYERPE